MKKLFTLQVLLAALLCIAVSAQAVRVVGAYWGADAGLGGKGLGELRPETRIYLGAVRGRVTLTYFVSPRRAMPAGMKEVEGGVRTLLAALKSAAPDRLDYRVLDPTADQQYGVPYASSRSASPIKMRKVRSDEASEEMVWSSLVIAFDQHPDSLIQGIELRDLPHLEDLIIESLKSAERPIQPVIALSAPSTSFLMLPQLIPSLTNGRILRFDFEKEPRIPREADLFIWIEPVQGSAGQVEELKRFMDSGRSVMLAGSAYRVEHLASPAGQPLLQFSRSPCDWKQLLRPFGLSLAPRLLLDQKHDPINWTAGGREKQMDTPFQLRVLPSQTDAKSLLGPPTGILLVSGVSPIVLDSRRLAAAGLTADVVSTSSELSRVMDLPDEPVAAAALEGGTPVAKQPWLVMVQPQDPWKGRLLVSATSTLFHDDIYRQQRNANQTFLRTLLRTFTDRMSLARIRVPRPGPSPLPVLSLPARIGWRVAAVFAVPVLLLTLILRGRGKSTGRSVPLFWATRLGGGLIALLVVFALVRSARGWRDPSLDVTEDKSNTASPLTRALLDSHARGLEAELYLSDSIHLPAAMKGLETRLLGELRALGIRPRLIRPEDLSEVEQAKLRAERIAPFEVESVQDDAPIAARVWSAIRLRYSGRSEVIPRLDPRTVLHLEFLLAAAVKRLDSGRPARVGVLADLPRLSPAEAHADYQTKGYTAPIGSDVYSLAKSLLEQHGYQLSYINPEAPVLPEGMDLLVWLQPRFVNRALPQVSDYLSRGGKAIVAVQYYNIQQRQYRGAGYSTVYWPQPQFHGFNDYLQLIGLRQLGEKQADQPGEILFDRNHGNLVLETQVNRSAFREHDPQQVARPFLIRVVADGLSPRSVITSRLGELLFIWGNRFSLDPSKMASLGIASETLAGTSPRTWVFRWNGGWIPDDQFNEPKESLGPQPLALLLNGGFPRVQIQKGEQGRDVVAPADPPPDRREGMLLLIGCSEMFKDEHLYLPEYQHDQLLLNAAALLAHGPDMAEIQARQRVVKSFPAQEDSTKAALRLVAIALGPAIFLAGGLVWRLWRRRAVLGRAQ